MPRFNVKYKDKWACFSSITDSFITKFTDKDSYEEWRKIEYRIANYEPAEQCNMQTIEESVFDITLNRNFDEAKEYLLESGLDEEECDKLLYDCQTKYYCPKINDEGIYECPNCHKEVKYGFEKCEHEYCETKLVWRE